MLLAWVFVFTVSCFCPLGSRSEVVAVGPFSDFASCERLRTAMRPSAAPCHVRSAEE